MNLKKRLQRWSGVAMTWAGDGILREIEADPLDIDDLKTELSKIDQQFSAVSKRFSDWERLQKESMKNMPRILF